MERNTHINFWYVVLALLGIILLRDLWVETQSVETIPYSEFEQLLAEGQVENVVVGSETIRGDFTEPHNGKSEFVTRSVEADMAERL